MAIYKNITTATTTTLTQLSQNVGNIKKIVVTNKSANEATVSVFLDDGTSQFHLANGVKIPDNVGLVLEDLVGFESLQYQLKITNSGTSPSLDVIAR